MAFRRVLHPGAMQAGSPQAPGLKAAVAPCTAFTFLTRMVYLDTVVRLGSLSAAYSGAHRLAYGLGAATASFVWFFGLGCGARLLQPVFAKPAAWRVLDIIIGVVMGLLAISLVVRFFGGS